jgi:glucokinase
VVVVRNGFAVGIEIGGSVLRLGLIASDGRVLRSARKASAHLRDQSRAAGLLRTDIDSFLAESNVSPADCAGIGIGMAGLVDNERRTMILASNLGWRDFHLGDEISSLTKVRTIVDKDTNMAAVGELAVGAGVGLRSFVYATLGTGVGGAVIYNGRLLRGIGNRAGEFGHVLLDGPEECGCGYRGCLETVAGGVAVAREARKALEGGAHSTIRDVVSGLLKDITAQTVVEAAENGDDVAHEILDRAAHATAVSLLNAIRMIYPEAVIIGGSLGTSTFVFESIREFVEANSVFPGTHLPPVRVFPAGLGDDAAIVGAGLSVFQGS